MLAVALIAAIVTVLAVVGPVSSFLLQRASVQATADNAALAAADVAAGMLAGAPCEAAQLVTAERGLQLDRCELRGLKATVCASAPEAFLPLAACAGAGPAASR